jgi:hypothetical protein
MSASAKWAATAFWMLVAALLALRIVYPIEPPHAPAQREAGQR